jgi:hypothetical protein
MCYIKNLAIRKCEWSITDMSRIPTMMPDTHRLQGRRLSLEEDVDGAIVCKRNVSKKKKADNPSAED